MLKRVCGISSVPNNYMFFETFKGCTGLIDYANMPDVWK